MAWWPGIPGPPCERLPVRRLRFPRRFGAGRLFGLWFLVHHPVLIVVVGVLVLALYLARRRR
jgi:hypothetical protein